jgi:5-methylcytosine-specific restriction protein A
MPNRAPRICPWCHKATVGRCPCRPKRKRATAADRGYDAKWQMASRAYLVTHRRCKIKGPSCKGRATCVDHIMPHKGDMKLFWDRKNWQAACASCHSRKTATKDGGYGNI